MNSGYKTPVSVLVLIHTPGLQVLLLERAGRPGYWQSVTGSQDPGETLEQTALREVQEETGLQAPPGSLRRWPVTNRFEIYPHWRHRYGPGVTHNTEYVFSLLVPVPFAPRLAPDEHTASLWLPWQEATKRVFSWSNREALQWLTELGARR